MRRTAIMLATLVALLGLTAGPLMTRNLAGTSFSFNWLGTPTAPQTYQSDGTWDVSVHKRGAGANSDPSAGGHNPDCSITDASSTHLITQLQDTVYICKNHLMTAISDKGYGQIDLTPNQLLDFSGGTAIATFLVSTQHDQARSWLDFWVTPWGQIEQHPFTDSVDLQGPPQNAVELRMCFCFSYQTRFDATVYQNGVATVLPGKGVAVSQVIPPSVTARTKFELDISQSHLRFGMPDQQNWFVDSPVNLNFVSGAFQMQSHNYDSCKDQAISTTNPCKTMDTWHWSDVNMSPTIPFTQIPSSNHAVTQQATTATFSQPAPANAFLRFEALGHALTASYNGAPPIALAPMPGLSSHEDHFSPFWVPVPAGTTSITFNGQNCYCGQWTIRDASIWSLSASLPSPSPTTSPTATPTATPTPTPSSTPSPTPAPTPTMLNNAPCTVTYPDGTQHVGVCSGTFTPN